VPGARPVLRGKDDTFDLVQRGRPGSGIHRPDPNPEPVTAQHFADPERLVVAVGVHQSVSSRTTTAPLRSINRPCT